MKTKLKAVYDRVQEIKVNYDFTDRKFEDLMTCQQNYWVIFPHPSVASKEEALSSPYPNISIGLDEEDNCYMALNYHNVGAVDNFRQLSSPLNTGSRQAILSILQNVTPKWKIEINLKTKLIHRSRVPDYFPVTKMLCKEVTPEKLDGLVTKIDQMYEERKKPGDIIDGKKVIWQIPVLDMMSINFPLTIGDFDTFDPLAKEVFDMFAVCNKILPRKEIEGELKRRSIMHDQLKILQSKERVLIKEIKKSNGKASKFPSMLFEIQEKIKKLEEEIKGLQKE